MSAARFSARNNTGAHFLRVLGDDYTQATLRDCLIADNDVSQELFARTDGGDGALSINSCTIANNTIGASSVIAAPNLGEHAQFLLRNSIIDQPGRKTVFPSDTNATFDQVNYVLTTDKTTLPSFTTVVLGEPTFLNQAFGDYHQVSSSLGADFAPPDTDPQAPSIDLDGNSRVFDLISARNRFGSMDLGAYELPTDGVTCYVSDTIFCNGFE